VNSASCEDELKHIDRWATNNFRLNQAKTVEIVFYARGRHRAEEELPPPLPGIQRVSSIKVLGVTISNNLSMAGHVSALCKLQDDLNRIQQWSDKWQLRFNSTKCKVIHLGHDNSKVTYTMTNDSVEHSIEEKDLGVWTDNKLKFSGHVSHIVAKGSQLLGLIRDHLCTEMWMSSRHYTLHLYDHI